MDKQLLKEIRKDVRRAEIKLTEQEKIKLALEQRNAEARQKMEERELIIDDARYEDMVERAIENGDAEIIDGKLVGVKVR